MKSPVYTLDGSERGTERIMQYGKLYSSVYSSPNIVETTKSRNLWTDHIVRMRNARNVYEICKKPLSGNEVIGEKLANI
jgi:hypothetical protein